MQGVCPCAGWGVAPLVGAGIERGPQIEAGHSNLRLLAGSTCSLQRGTAEGREGKWIQDLARVSRREEKTRPGLPCVLPLARARCRSGQVGADAGWGLLDDIGKLQREAEGWI